MKVNVEDIIKMMKFKREINRMGLEDIEWCLNGKVVNIAREDIDNFDDIGLNNTDFVSWYFGDKLEEAGLDKLTVSVLNGYKKEN